MTSRWRLAVLAVALVLAPGNSRADDGFTVYVEGGGALPVAPPEFPELWHVGWTAGVGFGVQLAPTWEAVSSVHYQRFGADEEAQIEDLLLSGPGGVLDIASIDGRDVETLVLLAEMRFRAAPPDARWRPFLGFGAGFAQVSTSDAMVTADQPGLEPIPIPGDSDVAFAASVDGGMARRVAPGVSVVFDVTYVIVFTEQSSTESLPFRLGLALD